MLNWLRKLLGRTEPSDALPPPRTPSSGLALELKEGEIRCGRCAWPIRVDSPVAIYDRGEIPKKNLVFATIVPVSPPPTPPPWNGPRRERAVPPDGYKGVLGCVAMGCYLPGFYGGKWTKDGFVPAFGGRTAVQHALCQGVTGPLFVDLR